MIDCLTSHLAARELKPARRWLGSRPSRGAWIAAQAAGRTKPKHRPIFNRHAARWKFSICTAGSGELVQMGHMSVSFPATVKGFATVCPATGHLVAHAYKSATSRNAARFLIHRLNTVPFAVTAIQRTTVAPLSKPLANNATLRCPCYRRKAPNTKPMWNAHTAHKREEFYG